MKELYPHNQKALDALKTALRTSRRTAIVQPTGTGKSYVAISYILERPELTVAYLSPSTRIFDHVQEVAGDSVKDLENTQFISYQKLQRMTEEEITALQFDVIILDEYHRCGAKKWQEAIRTLMKANPRAIYIGLSATPVRYLDDVRDMTEELFHSMVAHQYTLNEAIRDKVLPSPKYVLANIDSQSIYENAEARFSELRSEGISANYLTSLRECLDKMRRNIQDAEGVDEILAKYLPSNAKMIVFCRNYEHIDEVRTSMRAWLGERAASMHEYICKAKDLDFDADEQLNAFRDDKTDCVRLLYTVDMLNEGVHISDVDGIIMLRPTDSPNVYLQQMGRCLASGKGAKHPVILDLVNNYQKARVKDTKAPVLDVELKPRGERGSGFELELIDFRVVSRTLEFSEISDRFDSIEANKREALWWRKLERLKAAYAAEGRLPKTEDRK